MPASQDKTQTIRCAHCGYEWRPRAAAPKQCPYCKRYRKRETGQ